MICSDRGTGRVARLLVGKARIDRFHPSFFRHSNMMSMMSMMSGKEEGEFVSVVSLKKPAIVKIVSSAMMMPLGQHPNLNNQFGVVGEFLSQGTENQT